MVGGNVEYSVPTHFPIFYAGRVALRPFIPKTTQVVETTLVKVEVYNRPNRRLVVDPASFYRERTGRFRLSPHLCALRWSRCSANHLRNSTAVISLPRREFRPTVRRSDRQCFASRRP